jgi:hypothetical protein
MATGESTRDAFTQFLTAAFANLVAHSLDGSIHFVSMDWRRMGEMLAAGGANYSELKDLIVWVRDNVGMGVFYRPRHELIFAFKTGSAPEPGRPGRSRTNVWENRGVNALKPGRVDELELHPAAKPAGHDRRRDQGRLAARRNRSRSLWRFGLDLDRGPENRPPGPSSIPSLATAFFGAVKSSPRTRPKSSRVGWLREPETICRATVEEAVKRHSRNLRGRGRAASKLRIQARRARLKPEAALALRLPPAVAGSVRRGSDPAMSTERKIRLKPPPSEQPTYEIGYGKPPTVTQFKSGKSGNPRGRPKGARNKKPALSEERLKTIILEEAYRNIKISEGGRQVTIPMAKAVMRALAMNAARGQLRAQQLFATLVSETERANRAMVEKTIEAVTDYKLKWTEELERRKRLGVTGPDRYIHPDHLGIDVKTGQIIIRGRGPEEYKAELDRMRALLDEGDRRISELTEDLKRSKSKRRRQSIEEEIAELKDARDQLAAVIAAPKRRGGQ